MVAPTLGDHIEYLEVHSMSQASHGRHESVSMGNDFAITYDSVVLVGR